MSSTTVRSKSTASIAGSVFNPSYVKEQENVEIQGGEGFVTDKNELVKADGTVLEMKKPSAFKEIEKHKAETDKKRRASKEEEYR